LRLREWLPLGFLDLGCVIFEIGLQFLQLFGDTQLPLNFGLLRPLGYGLYLLRHLCVIFLDLDDLPLDLRPLHLDLPDPLL